MDAVSIESKSTMLQTFKANIKAIVEIFREGTIGKLKVQNLIHFKQII